MKSTVLKASPLLAKEIASDLLQRKNNRGEEIFIKLERDDGFEISVSNKMPNTQNFKSGEIIFKWVNKSGRWRIDYNEKLITIQTTR